MHPLLKTADIGPAPAMDAGALRRIIEEKMKDLPTLPIVVAKILQTAASPTASVADLQSLIAVDAGLTAKVLRLANSSFYGQSRRITTLGSAVAVLGFNTVRNLTLSVSMLHSLAPSSAAQVFDWKAYWEHCSAVAACARLLARRQRLPSSVQEEVFVGGLLHDIGKLFLGKYCTDLLAEVVLTAETFQVSMEEAEWQILGTNHALIGQEIAENWNFPPSLSSAIGAHHSPDGWRDDPTLTYLIHAANVLVQRAGIGAVDPCVLRLHPAVDDWLGLNSVERDDLQEAVASEVADLHALLGWDDAPGRANAHSTPGDGDEDGFEALVHGRTLAMAGANTLAEVRTLLLDGAESLAPIWGSALFLWDDEMSRFVLAAGGDVLGKIGEQQLRESLLENALARRGCGGVSPRSCLANVAAPRALRVLAEGHRFLATALTGGNKTIGILLLGQSAAQEPPAPAQSESLATLAAHAAAAVLRIQSFRVSVAALAAAIDARDASSKGHSERVRALCLACARKLGLPEARAEALEVAALLHDVGKLSLPDHLLSKPGQLDADEFRSVAGHTAAGAHLAGHTFGSVMPFILCHHERWDGTGYPAGLSGKQIPLESQIIAVAEAWDAMLNDRPYRAARPAPEARREIQAGSGTQFNPEVVEAFLSVLAEK